MDASVLQFMLQLAKGLARQFGPNCEVVVLDLDSNDPDSSIVAIENGQVTGRKVGDGPSHVVLEARKATPPPAEDHLAYLTRTPGGKVLKSSTLYIRDGEGKVEAVFSINFDVSALLAAESAVRDLAAPREEAQGEPTRITKNVADLLDDLLRESVELVGKPVALMDREDKIRAIRFLSDAGALLITKAGDKIAKYFGISKFTLYSYLDENK